ncbi:hypothetical protein QBC33DRAFT_526287 [Phialemonium atrogriseum]|uniref:EKC/KEOPS complex subunit BUD32 n=1 Tax=Phialemonium atrogriseum TaxID=1093897 RepID=A0AAJ0FS98_9PEZI|nr:uncharacterized protein QBC33DRAFT_526287 [Phialemonium atrogriseum]KAK1770955.1 hypothetical protein QBC33DRAFT_526287 [Phialemonium atrogriseum]
MMMEWIEGVPVRAAINEWLGERPGAGGAGVEPAAVESARDQAPLVGLMRRIGTAIGRMHHVSIVHGDLTTSNMMLRPWVGDGADGHTATGDGILDGDIVLIDFGLATQTTSEEDRAVDLYVLERAFGSTHPRAESLFNEVLLAYKETFKQAGPVLRRLEDVRMRGRKRSMIG